MKGQNWALNNMKIRSVATKKPAKVLSFDNKLRFRINDKAIFHFLDIQQHTRNNVEAVTTTIWVDHTSQLKHERSPLTKSKLYSLQVYHI